MKPALHVAASVSELIPARSTRSRSWLHAFALLCAIACLLPACRRPPAPPAAGPVERPVVQADRLLVGAHYYLWFPDNFKQGCVRQKLAPPQQPLLGWYDSTDPAVIEQHIAWCSRYGIDFLTLDWWPDGSHDMSTVDRFLEAPNIGDIRFCIFYETWGLGFNTDFGTTEFNDETIPRFVTDLLAIADTYFPHPSYLHVGDRPVLLLYLSRTFSGDFTEAMRQLRIAMQKAGHDPFIIADEVFWQVSPVVPAGQRPFPLAHTPQPERVRLFDAITAYNMYENGNPTQAGYGAESTFVSDVCGLYQQYRDAAGPGVYFVPNIIPGYNDRGVRPVADHYAIPRRWDAQSPEGSFLAQSFDRIAFPHLDPRLNMLFITSFNEWNEDTAIEPVAPAPATHADTTRRRIAYTQGYAYTGYGTTHLEVVRDKVTAVCGRITDPAGAPRKGVAVHARQGDRVVTATSDTHGYYRITRLGFTPGPCEIHAADQLRTVQITPTRTVTNISFALP